MQQAHHRTVCRKIVKADDWFALVPELHGLWSGVPKLSTTGRLDEKKIWPVRTLAFAKSEREWVGSESGAVLIPHKRIPHPGNSRNRIASHVKIYF